MGLGASKAIHEVGRRVVVNFMDGNACRLTGRVAESPIRENGMKRNILMRRTVVELQGDEMKLSLVN